jgi:hypothetical protein
MLIGMLLMIKINEMKSITRGNLWLAVSVVCFILASALLLMNFIRLDVKKYPLKESVFDQPYRPEKPFIIMYKAPEELLKRSEKRLFHYKCYDKNGKTLDFYDQSDKYNMGDTIK